MSENEKIPIFFYENEMARQERNIKRLWITTIILIISLVICNVVWIWYINQYDFSSYEYQQDGQGINIIGDSNSEVNNYGTESEDTQKN